MNIMKVYCYSKLVRLGRATVMISAGLYAFIINYMGQKIRFQ